MILSEKVQKRPFYTFFAHSGQIKCRNANFTLISDGATRISAK